MNFLFFLGGKSSSDFKDLKDVVFVPVTIDYERTLELSAMASEVMGKAKVGESLPNLLKWLTSSASSTVATVSQRVTSVVKVRCKIEKMKYSKLCHYIRL